MHELDLAALMVSRVCHDLISPVAAVSNGLEILADEQDPEMKEQAMALIAHSVGQAKARLLFARLAFGAMGSAGAEIDLGEAGEVATEFFKTGKAKLDWQAPRGAIDKEMIRVLLNLANMAADSIPRGGQLTVKIDPARANVVVSVTAKGTRANLAQDIRDGLELKTPFSELTGRTVQPYITALLAKKMGSAIQVTCGPETVRFDVTFDRKAAAA
jgi:histidine phosphotransferase ChpT